MDNRGYDRPEQRLIEAVAIVLVENLPAEQACKLAVKIKAKSTELSATKTPGANTEKLRAEVFRLAAEKIEREDGPIRVLQQDKPTHNGRREDDDPLREERRKNE